METLTRDFTDLDILLALVCEELQITPDHHSTATQYYNEVGKWLVSKSGILHQANPVIYPQGSFSTGTVIRPIKYNEFDVDLVCELQINWREYEPVSILNAVEKRLREKTEYASILKRKDRCLRLNHENEFHMDIIPACPVSNGSDSVKIPDRKLQAWKESNPRGFTKWFEQQCAQIRKSARVLNSDTIERLPGYEKFKTRSPLKLAVQLLKRNRDIAFKDKPEFAPASILLATISAKMYEGESSVVEFVHILISRLQNVAQKEDLIVTNPTNSEEKLNRAWDENPEAFREFKNWVSNLNQWWNQIIDSHGKGIPETSRILAVMFGEELTKNSIKAQTRIIESARKEDALKVSKSAGLIIGTSPNQSSPAVKRNTFHGN
jgi:hypothetical protein